MAPGTCNDLVIFEPFSQIQLSRSTYKLTSYVNFAPYVQSFKKFETYLVNFTNDLNSLDILKCFKEAYTTQCVWKRSKVQTFPNHYNCSESYQCSLSKQNRRIQSEIEHFGCIYYAVCGCFFNAIYHMEYHPSQHVTPNLQSSKFIKYQKTRRRACLSCKVRQYSELSTDEMKYLSKLKIALQKDSWKLHHNIIKNLSQGYLKSYWEAFSL